MTNILIVYYSSYGHIEVTGGTPYGATCVTGSGDELRMPSVLELQMCRFQGEHVARIASRLAFSAAA